MARHRAVERWTRMAREARAAADMQRTTHARCTMLDLADYYASLAKPGGRGKGAARYGVTAPGHLAE